MTVEAKRAAAVAAAHLYLARVKAGQAGPHAGDAGLRPGAQPGSAGSGPSLWALYGRRALMNQRIRMQARRRS